VNPRAGLDHVEKRKFLTLPGLELRRLGRPCKIKKLKFTASLYPVFVTNLNVSECQAFWFKMQQSLANRNDYVPKETNAVGKIVFGMAKT
jgi:hypothetical protein